MIFKGRSVHYGRSLYGSLVSDSGAYSNTATELGLGNLLRSEDVSGRKKPRAYRQEYNQKIGGQKHKYWSYFSFRSKHPIYKASHF